MFMHVNSLSSSHFSMVSGSLLPVSFSYSPIFPFLFLGKKGDEREVMKENSEDMGTVVGLFKPSAALI